MDSLLKLLKILTSAIALFRSAPAPARVGLFLFFVAGLADGVLMPFFALWAHRDVGIPLAYIGLLLGCYAGGELLAAPFVGGIADRIGRRPVLMISSAGIGLGFLLLYIIHGAVAAAASLIVIGIFESVLHPTAATVIADVVPGERLREHFALTQVMSNAGSMAGPALGALLALWSLGLVFLGAAAALLAGAAVVSIGLRETRTMAGASAADDDEDGVIALTAAFRDRRLAALLLPIAILEIAVSWIEAIVPLYANADGTLGASGIGLLFAFAGALGVIFQLPVTQATARMTGFSITLWSGVTQALAFVCLLVAPALPLLIAAIVLLAFSQMLSGPLAQTIVSELAPRNAQATYQAAFSAVGDLKDTAGPAIGTYLFALSSTLPWGAGVLASLAAALALAVAARRHETQ
ncbi:MAG TPA: MFS transporter [Pseudolabrys sp.]|jgi:DHA1 family tetracycline resistance protein-like MFS transporter